MHLSVNESLLMNLFAIGISLLMDLSVNESLLMNLSVCLWNLSVNGSLC